MSASNVISFDPSAGAKRPQIDDSEAAGTIANCRTLVSQALPRLLQDLFEKLDDDLYALADKSTSDALETEYFEAMRALRRLRQSIVDDFGCSVLDRYDRFWASGPQSEADAGPVTEELSLLEDQTLEEDLAIAGLASKAENRFHRELFALTLRFGHILGERDLAIDQNPLSPRVFGEAFRDGLARWDGEFRIRLLIYKIFERHVMNFIGGLYDDLNETLIDRGILPRIVNRIRRNPVSPSIARARAAAAAAAAESAAGASGADQGDAAAAAVTGSDPDPAQLELMGLLTQLVQQQRAIALPAQARQLPAVPTADVLGALDQLQLATSATPPDGEIGVAVTGVDLIPVLQQRLDMGSGDQARRQFGDDHQDLIDVVSMMFEFILEDRGLPDAMTALLGRLQIPILKLALLDRAFFVDKAHPARQLLNNLAKAAVGWSEDQGRGVDSLYGRMDSLVNRILTEFREDPELFVEINAEFVAFMEQEARSAEATEKRSTQVMQGQEQLRMARQRVNAVLFEKLHRYPDVHRAARELLMDAWKDVLLLAYLREGEDSAPWRTGLEIADLLLWSVVPKEDPDSRQRLLKAIPKLLKVLRDSLADISYDQHKANRLFKELQACHIAALRGESLPEADAGAGDDATAPDVVAEEVEVPAADEVPVSERDPFDELAYGMAVGQWLEWPHSDGRRVRGKLCWRSAVTGICVFVNRKGEKLADFDPSAIAAMLRKEAAVLIGEGGEPLVDRVLDKMVETLKDRTGEESNAD